MSAGLFMFWMATSVAGALLFLKFVANSVAGLTQRLDRVRKRLDV